MAQDKTWSEFVAWCRGRRLQPLPAHPWTVAAYVRWCDRRQRQRTLDRRLRAIARAHVLAGHRSPDRHPTVTRTLRVVDAKRRNRGRPLFRADDFLDPQTPTPQPDREVPRRRTLRVRPRLVSRRPAED